MTVPVIICSYMRGLLRQTWSLCHVRVATLEQRRQKIMFLDRPQKPATERDTKNNMGKTEGTGTTFVK